VKPPRKKNNVELSPKEKEDKARLVNMERNLNKALKTQWSDNASLDMAKELAALLASEEQRKEEEARVPNNVNVPELVDELASAETEIELMKSRIMDLETELRDLQERDGYFENIASISKKSFSEAHKQNVWLKKWIEDNLPGSNIRFRCQFADQFSDSKWSL